MNDGVILYQQISIHSFIHSDIIHQRDCRHLKSNWMTVHFDRKKYHPNEQCCCIYIHINRAESPKTQGSITRNVYWNNSLSNTCLRHAVPDGFCHRRTCRPYSWWMGLGWPKTHKQTNTHENELVPFPMTKFLALSPIEWYPSRVSAVRWDRDLGEKSVQVNIYKLIHPCWKSSET